MSSAPKSWKKVTEEIVREAKHIPLLGSPPPFPWNSFSALLKKQLDAPDFYIESKKVDWIPAGEWSKGMGVKPTVLSIDAPVLKGRLFWVASSEEVKETSLALLTSTGHLGENARTTPLPFLKGFYRYLALQVLDALAQTKAYPGLQFSLSDQETIPDESLFSIEIALCCKTVISFGRILIPSQTLASFREFFRVEGQPIQMKEKASHIDVALSLVIGKTILKQPAWNAISVGDLLLLDRCNYTLKKKRGTADLMIDEKTIAHCAIAGHTLEMLEYPTHEEEIVKPNDDENEEEFSSFDDPENEDEEFSEDTEEFDDLEDDNEDSEEEDQDLEEEEPEEEKEPEEEDTSHEEVETLREPAALTKHLPITLCVEVARLKMSLDKVLALQPGNILELLVSPEQGVTLTAGGKAVARGELVQLGEVLGVKITELG